MLCSASFLSITDFCAFHSLAASSKLVARHGTPSAPNTGISFSTLTISTSPSCTWPVCTARLISGALNSEAPGCTVMSSLPPDSFFTSSANCIRRSEEHTSELQSLMRISYAVFCLKKKKLKIIRHQVRTPFTKSTHNTHNTHKKKKNPKNKNLKYIQPDSTIYNKEYVINP